MSPLIAGEPHTSSKFSSHASSSVGSAAVSHAFTAVGPWWNFSSFGMRTCGWRLRYHRSFDVAAFCEPITMKLGRHRPRYAAAWPPWHAHGTPVRLVWLLWLCNRSGACTRCAGGDASLHRVR